MRAGRNLRGRAWHPHRGQRPGQAAQRGFTYLAVLFLVALTAAGLAALGQAWSTAAQREKERELEFRGQEIARAMRSYFRATPTPPQQYPAVLQDLLEDRRGPVVRRHLRRLYADPFTGQPDWVLVPAPGQPDRFHGLHSRSSQPLLRTLAPDGTTAATAEQRVFLAESDAVALPGSLTPAPAASAASTTR